MREIKGFELKDCRVETVKDIREELKANPKLKVYVATDLGFYQVRYITQDGWVICDAGNGFTRSFFCDDGTKLYVKEV